VSSHPRGLVVLVAGPDGAGKSSVARRIVDELAGEVTRVVHTHWRPGLLPHPRALVGGRGSTDGTRPHERPPHGAVLSLGLLGYYWLDFFLAGGCASGRPGAAAGSSSSSAAGGTPGLTGAAIGCPSRRRS